MVEAEWLGYDSIIIDRARPDFFRNSFLLDVENVDRAAALLLYTLSIG